MTKHNARHFARRRDPLVHPGATSEEMAIGNALAPFDRAVRETGRTWGIDRLPEIVSPESAAKWGSAVGKLNAAIDSGDVQEVTARVGVCLRGLAALDAEARAAGHQPISPEAWEIDVDGVTCAILRDDAAWPAFAAERPGVRIYSLQEVSNALAHYGGMVAAVKEAFPGARVTAVRSPLAQALDDDIPYAPETRA